MVLHPLLSVMWSYYPLLWRAVHLVIVSFSEGNNSYISVDLVCPWEEVSSGYFYTSPSPTFYPFICWWTRTLFSCVCYCRIMWQWVRGCTSLWGNDFISFRYKPINGITGLYHSFIFNFFEELPIFSLLAVTIYIATNSVQGFPVLYIFANIYHLLSFWW